MSAIDALYIFDRFAPTATIILQHEWRSRPSTSPASLLTHYNALPSPRPSLIYIPTTSPPTLLFNLEHSNLLLLSPATSEIEPLLVLEFLHRVVDVLEDYLGSPLMASKIESNYDIVAQLLNEMADDGFPFITEPNALRDVVLPPSLIGKLFSTVTGLPK
jgi:AP-3 complex subunit mu